MAGRRRRWSNSTIATVDDTTRRVRRETWLLKPRPQDLGEDDWPTFVMMEAVIYRPDGKTLGNPLLIESQGPFIVHGHVEVDTTGDDKERLVKQNVKSAYLEVAGSARYAIGYGPASFWVSGEAGWYEIRPSVKYEPMYNEILEAINLYYGIMEVLEDHNQLIATRKRKRSKTLPPLTIDQTLFNLVYAFGDCSLHEDIVARCDKWAEFFLCHFPKETQFAWADSSFEKWMIDRHQDLYKRLQATRDQLSHLPIRPLPPSADNAETPPGLNPSVTPERSITGSDEVVMIDAPSPDHKDAPRRQIIMPPEEPDPAQTLGRLIAAMDEIFAEFKVKEGNAMKITEKKVRSRIYFLCRMKNYDRFNEIAKYYSKDLLRHLGPHWQDTRLLSWLQALSKQAPDALDPKTIQEFHFNVLHRVKKGSTSAPPAKKPAVQTYSYGTDSDSESHDHPGKRVKRASKAGKSSVLRPTMRPFFSLDSSDAQNDDYSDAEDSDEGVTARLSTPSGKGTVRLVLHSEAIPSRSPMGPNGTWACEEEGCHFMVREANDEEGQQLIEEHYAQHEQKAQRLNLAIEESQRGHNPVDHLLQKLQNMSAASSERKANGEPEKHSRPVPIKRRLLA